VERLAELFCSQTDLVHEVCTAFGMTPFPRSLRPPKLRPERSEARYAWSRRVWVEPRRGGPLRLPIPAAARLYRPQACCDLARPLIGRWLRRVACVPRSRSRSLFRIRLFLPCLLTEVTNAQRLRSPSNVTHHDG